MVQKGQDKSIKYQLLINRITLCTLHINTPLIDSTEYNITFMRMASHIIHIGQVRQN